MTGSYDSEVIGKRFQLAPPPTALARTASVAPIGFTRLCRPDNRYLRAQDVPLEQAFALHVALAPTKVDLSTDGKHVLSTAPEAGSAFLFDLRSNPVSELHAPFDILRFYISQASLDELAFDHGVRGPVSLTPRLNVADPVMHGLAMALLNSVERPEDCSVLFVDHLALAFHAHLIQAYGNRRPLAEHRGGGLAPWQRDRAISYMRDRIDADPSIADLAGHCGLSHAYFARAFRRSTGATPHQWLMRLRVDRARTLMLTTPKDLAEIAAACGFVDQSHLNRVFSRFTGTARAGGVAATADTMGIVPAPTGAGLSKFRPSGSSKTATLSQR